MIRFGRCLREVFGTIESWPLAFAPSLTRDSPVGSGSSEPASFGMFRTARLGRGFFPATECADFRLVIMIESSALEAADPP